MIPTRLYADSMAINTLFYMFYMFLCVIKRKNIIFEKIFSGKNKRMFVANNNLC